MGKKDISTLDDIKVLVNSFYEDVRKDSLLGPIFNTIIQDRWPEHLNKMYRFWQTVLLNEHTYSGSPFLPHAKLDVDQLHFDRWLEMWHQNIDSRFEGEIAKEAKWRGDKMAVMFLSKISYYKNNPAKPLL